MDYICKFILLILTVKSNSLITYKLFVTVVMHKDKDDGGGLHRPRDLTAFDHTPLDGEMFLQVIIITNINTNLQKKHNYQSLTHLSFQALNGFLMILTCEGEVFFATHSIEGYLGFHQVSI